MVRDTCISENNSQQKTLLKAEGRVKNESYHILFAIYTLVPNDLISFKYMYLTILSQPVLKVSYALHTEIRHPEPCVHQSETDNAAVF